MKYCCRGLQRCVERKEIDYDLIRGSFWFYFKHDYDDGYGLHHLGYCPNCGARLPKDLLDEYCDELEKAVGKEYCDIKEDEIPEEFKSDEWWKKRGL